ncbi:Oidioi.mRNA.OKI2018_I69.chr1.g225.t1.cds [Oikopleura dioica]|uniref:Oidioi.mRNA.OKI2018_I69.chr1.g225.t1.cds n=1 Tax=Oikopleura dioica TaxID=34765 RepID=A0ABN7SN14_OIKDI|nr:Oidioi.mRNA.OKI2018_I69.chr1.g225.t1.cds [Oikopleura dioica]
MWDSECDSESCKIEGEKFWDGLSEIKRLETTIAHRSKFWPETCEDLQPEDCQKECKDQGVGDIIVEIFPPTCEETCGSMERNEQAASITEKFIWMLVLAELLILIIWSIDVLVDDEKKDPYQAAHSFPTLGIKIDKHLFENNEILFGSNNLNFASSSRIAAAVIHKDFDNMNLMNDIALLKLETPGQLEAGDEICIPENNWNMDDDFPFATEAFVAGYGVTSFGGFDKQTQLREVRVPLVDDVTCENKYDNLGFGNVVMLDDATICAGFPDGLNQDDNEADSCQGDSGGPLVQFDEDHGYHQVGIVSWGFGCASTYGIYTQVGNYVDWLKEARNSLDNCSSSSDCLDPAKVESTKPKPTAAVQVTQSGSGSTLMCKMKKGRIEPLRAGCRNCKEMKKNKCTGNPNDPLQCNGVEVHKTCKSCKNFKKGKCIGSPCRLSSGIVSLPAGCKNCKMLKKNKCGAVPGKFTKM